jgi:hypothetical protein
MSLCQTPWMREHVSRSARGGKKTWLLLCSTFNESWVPDKDHYKDHLEEQRRLHGDNKEAYAPFPPKPNTWHMWALALVKPEEGYGHHLYIMLPAELRRAAAGGKAQELVVNMQGVEDKSRLITSAMVLAQGILPLEGSQGRSDNLHAKQHAGSAVCKFYSNN